MSWNGGTFIRQVLTYTGSTVWNSVAVADRDIRSDDHDAHDQDLANGINNCLTKDGQNSPSVNLPMNGKKHLNVADATLSNEYATKGQLDTAIAGVESGGGGEGGASFPAGVLMPYGGNSSAPSGWLFCRGQAVNRVTYATLFAAIGTSFGAGNGSTTFNIPDMRGQFIRGFNNESSGDDASRTFGSKQDDEVKAHNHGSGSLAAASGGGHNHAKGTLAVADHNHAKGTLAVASHNHAKGTLAVADHNHAAGTLAAASAGAHTHDTNIKSNTSQSGTYVEALGRSNPGGANKVTASAGAHTHSISGNTANASASLSGSTANASASLSGSTANASASLSGNTATGGAHTHSISGSTGNSSGTETRPTNIAMNYIIKT